MTSLKNKPLAIRDEIHGDMTFDGLLRQVIDHDCFQRLRYIKQLGLAEYVFPCATHTRFQHSLGAAYLAGRYFHSLLRSWQASPFRSEASIGGTRLFAERTYTCVTDVAEHVPSREYWWQVVSLAGMLHDIGHGPWSHSFEELALRQDFSNITRRLPGMLGKYFSEMESREERFSHEDISVLYIFHILSDLEARGSLPNARAYLLPIATLVNKGLARGAFRAPAEAELTGVLNEGKIRGGVDFHQLLRPIISGPFDVDRIDYIQRDGRNCGVSIGGIEWRRIVSKVIPCLADHASSNNQPKEVCLLSNVKNQHVLDDFIFSLFQMYAQVYLHPKIVGIEEVIKEVLEHRAPLPKEPVITFELHCSLSDEKFREILRTEFNAPEIDRVLLRQSGFRVASYPDNSGVESQLRENGFSLVKTERRSMMKDSMGVFLFSSFRDKGQAASPGHYFLRPWAEVSPIAHQFEAIDYAPNIWLKKED